MTPRFRLRQLVKQALTNNGATQMDLASAAGADLREISRILCRGSSYDNRAKLTAKMALRWEPFLGIKAEEMLQAQACDDAAIAREALKIEGVS